MRVLFPVYTEETIMFDQCQEGDETLDETNYETSFETKISVGYIFIYTILLCYNMY